MKKGVKHTSQASVWNRVKQRLRWAPSVTFMLHLFLSRVWTRSGGVENRWCTSPRSPSAPETQCEEGSWECWQQQLGRRVKQGETLSLLIRCREGAFTETFALERQSFMGWKKMLRELAPQHPAKTKKKALTIQLQFNHSKGQKKTQNNNHNQNIQCRRWKVNSQVEVWLPSHWRRPQWIWSARVEALLFCTMCQKISHRYQWYAGKKAWGTRSSVFGRGRIQNTMNVQEKEILRLRNRTRTSLWHIFKVEKHGKKSSFFLVSPSWARMSVNIFNNPLKIEASTFHGM